jgi:hypothetical protein
VAGRVVHDVDTFHFFSRPIRPNLRYLRQISQFLANSGIAPGHQDIEAIVEVLLGHPDLRLTAHFFPQGAAK